MSGNHYIVDSSSLIDLQKYYPYENFPSLWGNLSKLVNKQLFHIPKEVFHEISEGDDFVKDWIQHQKYIIKEITSQQIQIVSEIMTSYPSLAKLVGKFNADPWLIALAYEIITTPQRTMTDFVTFSESEINVLIVTEETLKGNKIRVPFVAQQYDIQCIKILDLIKTEQWRF